MNIVFWIAEYIASFIELLFGFMFCGIFIDKAIIKENKRKIYFLSLLGATIVLGFNRMALFSQITVLIIFLLFSLLQYIVYTKHLLKIIAYSLLYFVLIILFDGIVSYFIVLITDLSLAEIATEHSLFRLTAIISSKTLLILLVFTIYKTKNKSSILTIRYLVSLMLLSISVFCLSFYLVLKNVLADTENFSSESIMLFISILALVLTLFFGIIKVAEHYQNLQQLSLLEMQNQMLKKTMDETESTFSLWKSSLHDYKHNIIHLMSLAENNDNDGIKDYLSNENKLLAEKVFYYQTGNDSVDALLNIKQTIAQEHNITFHINAVLTDSWPISDAHLCVILGNLIDNAIEASLQEENPFIEVNLKKVKEFFIIKICNLFVGGLPEKIDTSKENPFRGIGLKSVRKIAKDYGGEFLLYSENDLVIAEVMIC